MPNVQQMVNRLHQFVSTYESDLPIQFRLFYASRMSILKSYNIQRPSHSHQLVQAAFLQDRSMCDTSVKFISYNLIYGNTTVLY
jgi:hypothetical protein